MKKIDLSIIIVSHNTRELLVDCINSIILSLKETIINYEIIIVDNRSTDGSEDIIKDFLLRSKNIKYICNKQNLGFGKANNQGVEKADGKIILFLNSDIVVKNRSIEELFKFFIQQPANTIVGGKLFNLDGSPQPSCGPEYSLINIFTALFLKGDYFNITRYSPNTVKQVDWVMGACIMLSKDLFNQVGLFDEGIFMYMEEIDFLYRAKKIGAQILFYSEAHFVHVGAASSQGRSQPILNVFRGFIFFYKKHRNRVENVILRAILVLKAIMAIGLFTILGKKDDQNLYHEALEIARKY
jgi:GT2 family glycosyltransferase